MEKCFLGSKQQELLDAQSLPQRVQKMHFLNDSAHRVFCSRCLIPQCLKEEASGEELCLPPAAALCSWMLGTAPPSPAAQ